MICWGLQVEEAETHRVLNANQEVVAGQIMTAAIQTLADPSFQFCFNLCGVVGSGKTATITKVMH